MHNPDDQLSFFNLARKGSDFCATERSRMPSNLQCDSFLNRVFQQSACVGIFNLPQFANGFVYQSQRANEQYGITPYAYHATYSGNKVASLTEEGFWHLGDYKRRFLIYEPVLETTHLINHTWQSSWLLVQHQLKQLAVAVVIAKKTDRVLVLPAFSMSCHCFFYAIDIFTCMADGLRINLPYVAPSDHVLKPGVLDSIVSYVANNFFANAKPHERRIVIAKYGALSAKRFEDVHILKLEDEDLSSFYDDMKDDVPLGFSEALGSWCCVTTGKWPNDVTFKARYRLEGSPQLTRADDPESRHGTCGA
jgi:hypothetical protein